MGFEAWSGPPHPHPRFLAGVQGGGAARGFLLRPIPIRESRSALEGPDEQLLTPCVPCLLCPVPQCCLPKARSKSLCFGGGTYPGRGHWSDGAHLAPGVCIILITFLSLLVQIHTNPPSPHPLQPMQREGLEAPSLLLLPSLMPRYGQHQYDFSRDRIGA